VTREAIHRQFVFDQISFVAGRTFQWWRFMLAEQREFGFLVVIEDGLLPIILVMASLALGAKFSFVRFVVIFFVAREAGHL